MSRTAVRRLSRQGLASVMAATLLSGCGLLYPGWPVAPIDQGMPEEIGRFTTGSATMVLSGGMDEHVSLELVDDSTLMTDFGVQLQWRSPGWALTLTGYADDPGFAFGSLGTLQVDRLAADAHWQANDWEGRCDVEFEELVASRVSGTASCHGLLWMDAIIGPMGLGMSLPKAVEGTEPVDVEITFEARP